MNQRPLFKIALLAGLTLMLTACPTRRVERYEHEGPTKDEPTVNVPDVRASSKDLDGVDLEAVYSALLAPNADVFAKVVRPLKSFVMNPNYIQVPEFTGTVRLKRMLAYYNEALLRLVEANDPRVKSERLLDLFETVSLEGCDPELADLGGCLNIRFLRSDSRTSRLVQKIALGKADVRSYYKLLGFAYEVQNRSRDHQLEFMYLRRAREYAEYFQSLAADDRLKPGIRRHGVIFEMILRDLKFDPKDAKFQQFVAGFKPWEYSRLEENPFRFGTQDLLQIVAANYMYDAKGRLNQDLRKAIDKTQGSDDSLGKSFSAVVTELQSGIYRNVLANLNVDVSSVTNKALLDEYFYIVDRLYRGHIEVDEAVQIWRGTKKDEKRFLDAMSLYLRVQMVKRIVDTNEYMEKIFTDPDNDSTTMIKEVLERSKDISERWQDMLKRTDKLKRLINGQLKKYGRDSEYLDSANKTLDSIRRNIKFVVVYPNMFVMSYFISRNKAKFHVYSWFGDFEIDHTTIVESFMNGALTPWLQFGNDELALSKIELLYAYYFALNNGSFETYAQKKDSNDKPLIDRVRFLKEIVKEFMAVENVQLKSAIDEFDTNTGSSAFSTFRGYCLGELSGNLNFTPEQSFNDIPNYTYIGGSGSAANWALPVYSFYSGTQKTLDLINNTVNLKIVFFRTLIKILRDDLTRQGLSNEQIQASTKAIDDFVAETESYRTQYVKRVIDKHREMGDCVQRMRRREFDRQKQLLRLEMRHLDEAYDAILSLRKVAPEGRATQELAVNAKFGFTRDAKAAEGAAIGDIYKHDLITAEGYRYSKYDLYVRMMNRMKAFVPRTKFNVPSDLDLSVPVYQSRAGTMVAVLDEKGRLVSREAFIESAMHNLNSTTTSATNPAYLNWVGPSASNEYNLAKITALASLYRLTHSADFKGEVRAEEIVDEVMNMVENTRISTEDLDWLKAIGRDRRGTIEDLRRLVFDSKSGEELPLLEGPAKKMADNTVAFQEAKQFFLAMKHVGFFLFAPRENVLELMRSQYLPLVSEARERTSDMFASIQRRTKQINPDFLSFAYELNEGKLVYFRNGRDAGGGAQLIADRTVQDLRAIEREFDRETEGYFAAPGAVKPKKKGAR